MEQNKKKKKSLPLTILAIILILIFLTAGGAFGYLWWDYVQMDNVAKQAVELTEQPPTQEQIEALPDGAQEEAGAAYAANPDYIATITIPDTVIHYAVVQAEDNDKYLLTDFYGNYSRLGTVFADYRCSILPENTSDNIVIYGHNANNGSFFHHLLDYKSTDFANSHSIVKFDTIYGDGTYVVVGGFLIDSNATGADGFMPNNEINFTESSFENFKTEITQRSYFHTSLDCDITDSYITLSTCAYDIKDARFVLVARKLREGETEDSVKGMNTANSNVRMPDLWYRNRGRDNPFI